ncbi:TrbC/VirB2 family protein [Pinirhizobacter sp.]|jgi:type IV secretory pathway VirB2 component (pilin)|uniref:TrbC/VirB2 family protein n=1 Tax=Pinirhizobacter sp. TaxID=2950432 RepID=UPI002F422D60
MIHSASFWHSPRLRRAARLGLIASLVALVLAQPAFAQLDISSKATTAVNAIKNGVKFILVVAVLGSGVLAAFGRMSWTTVGQVLIGSIIAGLATEVVDALYQV